MLYTKAAALRILKGLATKIETVKLVRGVVLVVYRTKHGRCSTFLSKKLFKADFVEVRKEASQGLVSVELIPNAVFRVRSAESGRNYEVQAGDRGVACHCQDYRDQVRELGRGCCKHGYHVLEQWFGIGSLREYLDAQQKVAA